MARKPRKTYSRRLAYNWTPCTVTQTMLSGNYVVAFSRAAGEELLLARDLFETLFPFVDATPGKPTSCLLAMRNNYKDKK